MPKDALTRIAFCPHCCNRAPQTAIAMHTCTETVWFEQGDAAKDEEVDFDGTYFVATCETCQQLLLYWKQGDPANEGPSGPLDYFRRSSLIWPETAISGDAVPAPVAAIYREAAVVKRLSPNSFAVQIRRALEAVCADKGANGHSLKLANSTFNRQNAHIQTTERVSDDGPSLGGSGDSGNPHSDAAR